VLKDVTYELNTPVKTVLEGTQILLIRAEVSYPMMTDVDEGFVV
jgi:hypothetical protein